MMESGSFCSWSHCAANGSTSSRTKAWNSSCLRFCASPNSCCTNPLLLVIRVSVLLQDKSSRCVKRLEVLDVQIIHPHFDGESLFNEGHQLDSKQRIDDSRFEKVIVILQIWNIDGIEDEPANGFFHLLFFCSHRLL